MHDFRSRELPACTLIVYINVLRSNTQISCNCYKSLKYISYCMLYYIMTLVSSQFCLFIALCIQKTDKQRSRLSIKTKAMTSKYIPLIPQVAEGLLAVAFAAGSEPLLKREGNFVYRKEGTPVGAKTLYRAKTIYHDTFPINFLNTYNYQNNLIFLHANIQVLKNEIPKKFEFFRKKANGQIFAVFPSIFRQWRWRRRRIILACKKCIF